MGGNSFDLKTSYVTNFKVNEHCLINSRSGRILQDIPSLINTSKKTSLKFKFDNIQSNITKGYNKKFINKNNTLYLLARFKLMEAIDFNKYDSITNK